MLQNLFVKILALSFIFQFSFTLHTNDVKVNKKNSTVIWTGSKPTGSHTGNMNIKSGYLTYDHGQVVGGNFVIDMKSITCSDIESEKKNQYLVDHLKDADFFNVAKFPEASLTIIRVQKLKENQFQMLADLTIKGITKPVSFTADLSVNGNSYNAIAKIIIDRTKWGVEYKSGNIFKDLGDKIIYDDIEFDIFLVSEK
ncbi:MAG: YceI family protein [Flavobacteriales bacterium]|jgi:polyisoprenoid-binding protein YceI